MQIVLGEKVDSLHILMNIQHTTQNIEKKSSGRADIPSRYDQPSVGITTRASRTSKQAPIAQNVSTRVTAVARELVGKNSA